MSSQGWELSGGSQMTQDNLAPCQPQCAVAKGGAWGGGGQARSWGGPGGGQGTTLARGTALNPGRQRAVGRRHPLVLGPGWGDIPPERPSASESCPQGPRALGY